MTFSRMQRLLVLVLILGTGVLTAGCGTSADLSQPRIYQEPMQAYVDPGYNRFQSQRLAIFPFEAQPTLPEVRYRITEIFYRQLLKNWAFAEIVRLQPADERKDAFHLARRAHADLLMVAQVPYFLDSGGMGKSGLQVDLKVLEVKTGRLLWYLSDSISAEPRPIIDLWVTETTPKPAPGIYQLADMLATRMIRPMTNLPPLPGAYIPPPSCTNP